MFNVDSSNKKSNRWAWMGGLVGLLLSLFIFAPAQWIAHSIALISKQQMTFQNVEGTVWNGSAQTVVSAGVGATQEMVLPERLHWRFVVQWDVSIQLFLKHDCCMSQPMVLTIKPLLQSVQVAIDDHQSRWPATWLQGLGAPWNTIAPSGWLAINTKQLQLSMSAQSFNMTGDATIDLQSLGSRLTTTNPLGSYQLQVHGGQTPTVQLSTLEGVLQLQGQGQWLGQRLRFNGEAKAAEGNEDALFNLLGVLGQRRGSTSILKLG
ncbi:MAG: type II secretion system protein N [Limnohabitans sp.]|nr:type II secretion system protein N [Limnohabitans sp.]